jgi:hypothetical protein
VSAVIAVVACPSKRDAQVVEVYKHYSRWCWTTRLRSPS